MGVLILIHPAPLPAARAAKQTREKPQLVTQRNTQKCAC